MTAVWYRPKGSRGPRNSPASYDLWYREYNGRLETTTSGRRTWDQATGSVEFDSLEDFLQSGIGIRVQRVGDTEPFDTDFEVDEGL